MFCCEYVRILAWYQIWYLSYFWTNAKIFSFIIALSISVTTSIIDMGCLKLLRSIRVEAKRNWHLGMKKGHAFSSWWCALLIGSTHILSSTMAINGLKVILMFLIEIRIIQKYYKANNCWESDISPLSSIIHTYMKYSNSDFKIDILEKDWFDQILMMSYFYVAW